MVSFGAVGKVNIFNVLRQGANGFQFGLFAFPDYCLRKLTKDLGGTEKDAFQLSKFINSFVNIALIKRLKAD